MQPSQEAQNPDLRDLTPLEVQEIMVSLGQKPFRARQLLQWLYRRGARDFGEMTDLSKDLRARLAERSSLYWLDPVDMQVSADGAMKLLFELADGAFIESVLIPEEDHSTLCVSSQVGCRMGCAFCRTAGLGFRRDLAPSEITGQVLTARTLAADEQPLTNIVFMGMGEPLDNLDNLLKALEHILGDTGLAMSQRKVTVSTVGRVDQLARLGQNTPAALAVSLNAPNDTIRSKLMPVNRKFSMAQLKAALLAYPLKPTRRITLEYVLLGGVNDRPEHARELALWTRGLRCKVNLIAFNPHQGAAFEAPRQEDVARFQEILLGEHVTALLRKSRGADIDAACGQLAAKRQPTA